MWRVIQSFSGWDTTARLMSGLATLAARTRHCSFRFSCIRSFITAQTVVMNLSASLNTLLVGSQGAL